MIGLSFTAVGGGTSKLGDFKPVDGTMSADDDAIQVINPTTLGTEKVIVYLDKTTADAIAEQDDPPSPPGTYDELIGWWDMKGDIGEISCNDDPVTPGMGFMGMFDALSPISFQSAGEAPTVTTSLTTDGTRSPIICNYIPKTIKLGQMAPVDGTMSADDDAIQVINPTTLGTEKVIVYLDKTTADAIAEQDDPPSPPGTYDELIGWWDMKGDIGEIPCGDDEVPAGSGFMGMFDALSPITFQFPSSLD